MTAKVGTKKYRIGPDGTKGRRTWAKFETLHEVEAWLAENTRWAFAAPGFEHRIHSTDDCRVAVYERSVGTAETEGGEMWLTTAWLTNEDTTKLTSRVKPGKEKIAFAR